jgi:hypothetical protein
MSTERALSVDLERKTQREECEAKIRSAFRRGLMATCEIAKELSKILREELYLDITPVWKEYVTDYLNIAQTSYDRIIQVSQTIAQLQEKGLVLPENETVAAELARLETRLRAEVWNDLVTKAEKEDKTLTSYDVRRAVEAIKEGAGYGDVEVDMEDDGSEAPSSKAASSKKADAKDGELILTEKGESALARIKKICGKEIADAIEDGTKAMTEREMISWSDYDDDMMRQLVFFLFDQGYALHKAVNFLAREITDTTEVHDLILVASARGGTARVNVANRAIITVELSKT